MVAILVWDFSEFTERVSLQDSNEIPVVVYNGLSVYGNQSSDGKDYMDTSGIRFNGGGHPAVSRCIAFTPLWDATLSVTFESTSTANRTLKLADGEDVNTIIATVSGNNAGAELQAELTAGQTYYIWMEGGGGLITSLTYEL